MITRSRKRAKHTLVKKFWLDEMPIDVRETIAGKVVDWEKLTDAALSLAQTSDIQRRAVLASMNDRQIFNIEALELSDAWTELLVGYNIGVSIHTSDVHGLKDGDYKHSPLIRLLSAPQLREAAIPGVTHFLVAIRNSMCLKVLEVSMRSCSYRSLVCTLKHFGSSLRSLSLSCSEYDAAKCDPPSPDCPMSLCTSDESYNLASLCPNLDYLQLNCSHSQPSTFSSLAKKLPSLRRVNWSSLWWDTIELSDDDIEALRGIGTVSLGNVSGGLQLASRVGASVLTVTYDREVAADTIIQLVNCPLLWLVSVHMASVEGLSNWIQVAPKLPNLETLTVVILPSLGFQEIEDTAMTAMKILRGLHRPVADVVLIVAVDQSERHVIAENIERIAAIVAREDWNLTHEPGLRIGEIVFRYRKGTPEEFE